MQGINIISLFNFIIIITIFEYPLQKLLDEINANTTNVKIILNEWCYIERYNTYKKTKRFKTHLLMQRNLI